MAERHTPGLQRVLGVNALFSTAYGNVGSSIYYALGLVASFALGLTPIVFIIAGGIFYLTAATYAEATAMYPEAGGSSSFARHAFNEFWSFFAAWGQMLNYVITVAISAFFVPHYIGGLFWAYLKTSPGDIIVGIAVIVVLCAINIVGVKEAAGVNVVLAFTDFSTQLAAGDPRLRTGAVAGHADQQRPPRHGADVEELHHRDPRRDDRLYGHRNDLEHGRGGQATSRIRSPRRSKASSPPCSRSTRCCPPSRCLRCR